MLETGNKKYTEQELSIRIFSDGFSFSTQQSHKEVTAKEGESLKQALETSFKTFSLLRPDYDEVNIYADYPSTRIPLDEFRSEEAKAIYQLTFGQDTLQGMNIHYEMLPALEVIEVFVLNAEIEQIILQHYPQATIHSYFGQMLNRMLSRDKRRKDEGHRLYAHTNGRQFFIFAYDQGKLCFANTFEVRDLSNQVYFLLYVWKQLELNQRKDTCVLLGKNAPLEAALHKYLSNIECE